MTDFAAAFARIDAFVDQRMRAANTLGLALALTDRDRLLHVATYGFADIAARTAVAPDTLFEIGSIGKSFTAVALLQLHETGELDLHAPVTRYLPWFAVRTDHAPITLHHLLSHTAGIIAGTDGYPDGRAEVWSLRDTETGGPPGDRFHYSNVGYKALGLVLAGLTGETYPDTVRRRILDPLTMTASEPVITHDTRRRLAVGYTSLYDDRPSHPSHPLVPATWLETDTADGSIAATPADMAAYLRMLLNRGRGPHNRILSEAGFDLLTQPVAPAWDAHYGYGLFTQDVEGHTVIGHPGGMVGYAADLVADLDAGLGVIVLVNGPGNPYAIARFALSVLRAAQAGDDLPPLPEAPDRTRIDNAADYAGTFTDLATGETLTLAAEGERLVLRHGTESIPLERFGDDPFRALHPEFDRFPLSVHRAGERVVELIHGPSWYVADAYDGPTTFDHPAEWDAYPGHYRAHNPWATNFRVHLRKGQLWLTFPSEPEGFDDEQPLVPLGNGRFRAGDDPANPERLSFDAIVDGQALRATLSGCDYARFFTP